MSEINFCIPKLGFFSVCGTDFLEPELETVIDLALILTHHHPLCLVFLWIFSQICPLSNLCSCSLEAHITSHELLDKLFSSPECCYCYLQYSFWKLCNYVGPCILKKLRLQWLLSKGQAPESSVSGNNNLSLNYFPSFIFCYVSQPILCCISTEVFWSDGLS